MPKYRVTLSDGRTFDVEANAPPSEADIMAHLGSSGPSSPATAPAQPPSRAGYYQGVTEAIPKIANAAVNALPAIGGTIGGIVGGIGGTVAGFGVGGVPGGLGGAALGGAAGESARQLVNRVRGGPVPTTSGQAASGIAGEGLLQGAMQGVGGIIGNTAVRAAQSVAPMLMQSALKPGLKATLAAVKGGKVPPVVRTLLDEGVNVTPGGIAKLNSIIDASNEAITDALAAMPATPSIAPIGVAGRLSPMAQQAAKQVNPASDLAAISDAGQEFLAAHGAQNLTPQAAQAMKTATYKSLGGKSYGEVKTIAVEAQKALARGLKEEIEREAKASGIDIAALNAREGAAITAKDAIARRVAMVGNRDPAGLAWLAHSPTTFIMALAERSPVVKTYLARGLWQAAAKSSGMPVDALKFAMGAIASHVNQEQD